MQIKRRIVIWILPIILLAMLIPFVLPSALESYLEFRLQSDELTDVQVDIEHIGLTAMRIGKIRFYYRGQDYRAELITNHVAIDYSLASLVNRQLDAIDIKTLNILVNKNTDPVKVVRELNTRFSLPLLDDIPFQSLQLRKARVVVRGESRDDIKLSAVARIEKHKDSLHAKLDIERVDQNIMHANLVYQQGGRIEVTLREGEDKEPLLDLQAKRVVLVQQQLDAAITAQVDFARLGVFLQSMGLAQAIENPAGKIKINAELLIPLDFSLPASEWLAASRVEAEMDLDFQARHWPGLGKDLLAKIPLAMSVKDGQLNWQLSRATRINMLADLQSLVPEKDGLAWLSPAEGKQLLNVSLPNGLSGQVGRLQAPKTISVNNKQFIKVDYGKSEKLFHVNLKIMSPVLLAEQAWSLKSHINYRISLPHLKQPEIHALNVTGSADLLATKNKVQFDVNKDASMTASVIKHDTLTLQGMHTSLLKMASCMMNLELKTWRCAPFMARLSVADVATPDMTFRSKFGMLNVLDLNNDNGAVFVRARLDFSDNTVLLKDATLKVDKFRIDTFLNKSRLNGQLHLGLAKSAMQIDVNYRHNILTSQGNLDFLVNEVDFSASPALLAKIVSRPVIPVQLSAGKLSANGRLSWKPAKKHQPLQLKGKAFLVLQALNGKLKNSDFKGMSTQLEIVIKEGGIISEPVSVSLDYLNSGVEVSDIKFTLSGQLAADRKPLLHIGSFTAKTLEGTLVSKDIHLDLNKANNPFVIRFHDLSLSKLLELEKDQGLSGTGVIEGVLPFDYKSGEGLFMQQGNIFARDPGGLLQYQATERVKALAENNPNIKLLLDALNNFNYNKLKADANYTPDGKLNLSVLLQGNNPGFQHGRSVHFNVNVEENILQLMRSLQLGDEIGERLGDRILKQKQ